jgi:hypothetical protein
MRAAVPEAPQSPQSIQLVLPKIPAVSAFSAVRLWTAAPIDPAAASFTAVANV